MLHQRKFYTVTESRDWSDNGFLVWQNLLSMQFLVLVLILHLMQSLPSLQCKTIGDCFQQAQAGTVYTTCLAWNESQGKQVARGDSQISTKVLVNQTADERRESIFRGSDKGLHLDMHVTMCQSLSAT